MNKKTLLFSAFILTVSLNACAGQQTGSAPSEDPGTAQFVTTDGSQERNSVPASEESQKAAVPKETPADLAECTGKFLRSTGGDGILVIDDYGPVVFTYEANDRSVLDTLEDGDVVSAKIGLINETWPGQTSVYECTLLEKGKRNDIDPDTLASLMEMGQIEKASLPRMFYARDTLFTDTGRIARPTCGTEDGSFSSIIGAVQVPMENGQANFGSQDDGYISLWDGAMAVKTGDDYSLFLSDGMVEYEGRFFKKSDLSDDVLTWLDFYNGSSEEDRAAISYVPFELWPEKEPGMAKETDSPS